MNYKQFRTEMVSKGCIIRGGGQCMTIFSPRVRLELQYVKDIVGNPHYTVYNVNDDITLKGLYSLLSISEMIFAEVGSINLYSWYNADWKVRFKGNSLYNIGQLIEDGRAQREDIALALQICDDMRYLILMSDFIPDEEKNNLCKDVLSVKAGFAAINQ